MEEKEEKEENGTTPADWRDRDVGPRVPRKVAMGAPTRDRREINSSKAVCMHVHVITWQSLGAPRTRAR